MASALGDPPTPVRSADLGSGDGAKGKARMTSTPSAPTVANLLATPGLRLRLVSGDPTALARTVRWVHTTELPDPAAYLRGGELVCTVGVSLGGPDACAGFAAAVASAGAVGVCFGVGDVHAAVPAALVAACSDLGLVLLALPAGAPFLAVGERLADRWAAAGAAETLREDHLVRDLLATVGEGATVQQLIDLASNAVGGALAVTPDSPTRVDWSGVGDPPSVALLGHQGAIIDIARHECEIERRSAIGHIGHVLALVADGLANPDALRPALESAGLREAATVTVTAWPAGSADHVAGHAGHVVVGDTGSVVLTLTKDRELVTNLASTTGLPCGVGPVGPLAQLARAIAGARTALTIAERRGGLVGPESLTTLEALLEQQPSELLRPFVDQIIRPLLDADRHHGTAQLETLREFLANDSSLQRTARQQFLHVNTVRHRLERARALTGRDPFTFSGRAELAIALWAYDHGRQGAHDTRGQPPA